MEEIVIYTDGACSGNPGPGGYAAILIENEVTREISGCESNTTNNRMEMMAVIKALENIKRPSALKIFTDSTYLKNGFTLWLPRWQKNGWKTSENKPVKNKELWLRILDLTRDHQVQWVWVKGHGNDSFNRRCDYLARKAMERCL